MRFFVQQMMVFGFQLSLSFIFQDDLWASLSYASSKPVAAVMDTWTKQMGYPVLSLTAEQVGITSRRWLSSFSIYLHG